MADVTEVPVTTAIARERCRTAVFASMRQEKNRPRSDLKREGEEGKGLEMIRKGKNELDPFRSEQTEGVP